MVSGSPDYISQEKEYVQKFFLPFNTNITEKIYYGTVLIGALGGVAFNFIEGAGYYRQLKHFMVYSDAGNFHAYIQVQIIEDGEWYNTFRLCGSGSYKQSFEDFERAMIFSPAWNIRIVIYNDTGGDANLSWLAKYAYQTS